MSNILNDLHALLKAFVQQKGSDLFITVNAPVSFKRDGEMHPLTQEKLTFEASKQLVLGLMNDYQKEEFSRTLECNYAYQFYGVSRFRINAFMQRNSYSMVIRVIHTEIPDLESLNLPPIISELIMEKRGLILFVGGTGSGKSTSLAAMIGYRNKNSHGHIITVEDPIEFLHTHDGCIVTQRDVGVDTQSYAAALKNTLRQAPDVILIGEVREREIMEHTLTFAETGHLCLSTLHANNTNQALERIVNFFSEESRPQLLMNLSLNLKALISQRLIPKIGGGRIAAVEVLINTPRMAELIFSGKILEIKELITHSSNAGMQTFDQSLFELYEAQQITYENALRHADSMNDLRLNIKLNSQLERPKDLSLEEATLTLKKDES